VLEFDDVSLVSLYDNCFQVGFFCFCKFFCFLFSTSHGFCCFLSFLVFLLNMHVSDTCLKDRKQTDNHRYDNEGNENETNEREQKNISLLNWPLTCCGRSLNDRRQQARG